MGVSVSSTGARARYPALSFLLHITILHLQGPSHHRPLFLKMGGAMWKSIWKSMKAKEAQPVLLGHILKATP